ncbi:MAG TPA: FAD-binding oxidoreductase [Devosia sp.]
MSLTDLKSRISGRLVLPADTDYDKLRQVIYGGIDKHPAAIALVKTAADVADAVNYARDHGLELAVRSGGHSIAGYSLSEGGLVIDMREMNKIELDVPARTAWAEAGATAGQFTKAAEPHGLVVGFGDTGSVGLGGLVTGGGVGYLVRKLGLTIDSLLAAEVVTADGQLHKVDASNESDLFWAIRGGGGNFGVVTRMQFRLSELPAFTGGMMVLPATAETIDAFVAAAEAAPEEFSGIGNVMPAPPMPFLDASLHGKPVILSMLAWSGDPAQAEKVLAPFRALKPLADMVKTSPYSAIFGEDDPDYHPTAIAKTLFVDGIDGTTVMKHVDLPEPGFRVLQIRVLGGAHGRVAPDATAYAHRNEKIMLNVAAFYDGPEDKPKRQAWVDTFSAALKPRPTAYVNFLADEGPDRVRAAYPDATWDRLRQIKAKYDPQNLFRLNQNIPPAAA